MGVAHDEDHVVCVVLHQLEVVTSFPVIFLFEDINVFEVLLGKLDDTGTVLHVEGGVGHHDMVKNFNLLELAVEIFGPLDVANTIRVETEAKILLQPSEGLWLPFHINIEPIVASVEVWHLNISITILTGDLGIDECAAHEAIGCVLFDKIEDAISIFVSSSSWEKS